MKIRDLYADQDVVANIKCGLTERLGHIAKAGEQEVRSPEGTIKKAVRAFVVRVRLSTI